MTRPMSPATPLSKPTASPSGSAPTTSGAVVVQPAIVDGVDVDAIARAVRACVGVSDLYSGRFGEIGSYLPGRRVSGVQVNDAAVTVHIRARWGYGVRDLFAQIDAVTATLRHNRRLDVVVDDIDDDPSDSVGRSVSTATAVAPPLTLDAQKNPPSP